MANATPEEVYADDGFRVCACCLRKPTSPSLTTYHSASGPGYGVWYKLCKECEEWCDRDMEW